jgi:hypothetical protein
MVKFLCTKRHVSPFFIRRPDWGVYENPMAPTMFAKMEHEKAICWDGMNLVFLITGTSRTQNQSVLTRKSILGVVTGSVLGFWRATSLHTALILVRRFTQSVALHKVTFVICRCGP